ncbi:MAG: hypothetical protein FJ106_08180 [Deltaproteobacteria bacterium]|nr:hypothetical protein [Deltaproteobacteria bacterium]
MKEEVIRTVLDEDIGKVLDNLGQLEAVQNGEIHCCECGIPVSVKSIQIIMPLEGGNFKYVCNNTECVLSYSAKHGAV